MKTTASSGTSELPWAPISPRHGRRSTSIPCASLVLLVVLDLGKVAQPPGHVGGARLDGYFLHAVPITVIICDGLGQPLGYRPPAAWSHAKHRGTETRDGEGEPLGDAAETRRNENEVCCRLSGGKKTAKHDETPNPRRTFGVPLALTAFAR